MLTHELLVDNSYAGATSEEPVAVPVESTSIADRASATTTAVATVNPWHARADELAAWATRYFVRNDRFGGYGDNGAITRPGKPYKNALKLNTLVRHFKATSRSDVIGAHTLHPEHAGGRFAGVDIDAHEGSKADPASNEAFALRWYEKAKSVGLLPLVYDSNGNGGFHGVVFFSDPKPYVPGPVLYGLALWLADEFKQFGFVKRPETYPKQRTLPKEGYGNWLRVIGRHHSRDFWPRVWNGSTWLEGEVAVAHVLSIGRSDSALIPHEARLLGAVDARLAPTGSSPADPSGGRPGDDFNTRGGAEAIAKILTHSGWRLFRQRSDGVSEWTRPGKDTDSSGTLGFCNKGGVNKFYCWTDAASPLGPNKAYTAFNLLATLHYAGDFAAAAAECRRTGFGSVEVQSVRALPDLRPGEQSTASKQPEAADDEPKLGVEIIRTYFAERYKPLFKRGNAVFCADGETVPKNVACDVPTSELINRLYKAPDAPSISGGGVNRSRLPGFFKTWASVAWGDLLANLPDEDTAELTSDGSSGAAREEFRRMVRDAMLSDVVLGEQIGKSEVTQTERRPLIDWCYRFAAKGPWRDIRGKRCWCKIREEQSGELVVMVAIRHELFNQVRADRKLCTMNTNTFTRRAGKYGVGTSTRAERPHGQRALVLDDDFVRELLAGFCEDDMVPDET